MKNRFLAFLLPLFIVSAAHAAVVTPKDDRGFSLETIDFVGSDTAIINPADGIASLVLSSGSIIVYGLTATNAAPGDFITFRSTNIAGITVATATVIMVSTAAAGSTVGTNATYFVKMPVPFKLTNGMNVKLNAAVGATGNWTIFYRKKLSTD